MYNELKREKNVHFGSKLEFISRFSSLRDQVDFFRFPAVISSTCDKKYYPTYDA